MTYYYSRFLDVVIIIIKDRNCIIKLLVKLWLSVDISIRYLQARYGCPGVYGAVQGKSYGTLLRVPSVLCRTVVFGQILVLFFVYTTHAGSVWVYFGTTTTTEHGRNPENGKQTTYFAGNSGWHLIFWPVAIMSCFKWYIILGWTVSYNWIFSFVSI